MISQHFSGGVATVTLERPEHLNAFDPDQILRFAAIARDLGERPELKAAVVTGAGKAFSVGLDLELLKQGFAEPDFFREQLDAFGDALTAWEQLPFPTIAAVNGVTRAGGFELMLACDLAIADSNAKIGDTHLASGLPPGGGASARLPRKVNRQIANEILYTGKWLSAAEAAECGLVLRATEDLGAEIASLTGMVIRNSGPAVRAMKQILRDSADKSLGEALKIELEHFERFIRNEPSASEGMRAFLENRKPTWQ